MMVTRIALACVLVLAASQSLAQDATIVVPSGPSVHVTGAAHAQVQNDRMQALLRIEVEHASAASAANDVNARMAKALGRAKSVAGVEAKSAGYSTWQQWEKGRPAKWKVVQSIALTGNDFGALAALVTRLQDEDGMLVTAMTFSVAPDTRRKAEDALMREAVRTWQQRASVAAEALGYSTWRAGRVSVNTSDSMPVPRPEIAMRAQAMQAAPAPVSVEGGTTDITVTVSGDAVLDKLTR
jgi:predicted secreted protein